MMIRISVEDVPEYLRDGEFFRSLDETSEEVILVPEKAMKENLLINSDESLAWALESLRFWGVFGMPFEIIDYILSCDHNPAQATHSDTFLLLHFLEELRTKFKNCRMEAAIDYGSPQIYRYLIARGYSPPDNVLGEVLTKGKIHILKHLLATNSNMQLHSVAAAFFRGHVECLQLLLDAGYLEPFRNIPLALNSSVPSNARSKKLVCVHLHTFIFAVDAGWVLPVGFMNYAVEESLEWLKFAKAQNLCWLPDSAERILNECGGSPSAYSRTTKYMLEYACNNGCELNSRTMAAATFSIAAMTYLRDQNCPWDVSTMVSAIENENIDCMNYALEHNCPLNARVFELVNQKICGFSRVSRDVWVVFQTSAKVQFASSLFKEFLLSHSTASPEQISAELSSVVRRLSLARDDYIIVYMGAVFHDDFVKKKEIAQHAVRLRSLFEHRTHQRHLIASFEWLFTIKYPHKVIFPPNFLTFLLLNITILCTFHIPAGTILYPSLKTSIRQRFG